MKGRGFEHWLVHDPPISSSGSAGLAIAASGFGADEVGTQPLAGMAHPADAPRRHARHQGEGRHVPRHHRAGGDEAVFAE